jgi:hypothetical protein
MPGAQPALDARDLALLAGHLVALPAAWLLPARSWLPLARLAGRGLVAAGGGAALAQRLALFDPPAPGAVELRARGVEQALQYLRAWRPGGWQPSLRLRGAEHLDAALREGKGAIVWVANFTGAALLTKRCLREAGYPLIHLSVPEYHGLSTTRLGGRMLNPIRLRPESLQLRERVVMSPAAELPALRRLEARVRANGIVSMSCVPLGRRKLRLAAFGGRVPIATGPASLSLGTGAGRGWGYLEPAAAVA